MALQCVPIPIERETEGVLLTQQKPVFRFQWPADIQVDLVSKYNLGGRITNSDPEMVGLLLLWLIMKAVCTLHPASHVAVFSDNQPTVCWV